MLKILENEKDFNEEINKDFLVVDFYADWCGPCRALAPVLEDIAKDKNIDVLKVNVDSFENLAREYKVMVIPTLMIFKKGELVKSNTGLLSKSELNEFIS